MFKNSISNTNLQQPPNYLVWMVVLLYLIMNMFLWSVNFQQIIELLHRFYNPNPVQLKKIELLLNEDKLLYIKVLISIFSTTSLIICYQYFHQFLVFIKTLLIKTKSLFALITWQSKALVIITIVLKTVLLFYLPLHLDELFSYLFLSSKGAIISISYYPGPNNHVAYNVLSSLFLNLHLPSQLAIRLPSLIADFLIVLICIKLITSLEKNSNYIFLILFISFSSNYLPYSISGRGYALQTLFSLIAFVAVLKWKYNKTFYNYLYILANIMGLWVVPTHLFAFFSISIIGLYINKNGINTIVSNVIIAALTMLLYSPILILNGSKSIINNAWVKPLSNEVFKQKILTFILDFLQKVSGIHNYEIAGIVLITIIISLAYFKKNNELMIFLSFILLPFVIIVFQKVTPFIRVFSYLNLLFSLGIIYLLIKYELRIILFLFILIQCISLYSFINNMIDYKHKNSISWTEKMQLLNTFNAKNIRHILVKDELEAYQLAYLAKENDFNIYIKWDQSIINRYMLTNNK